MHQASEHATTAARHRLPARPPRPAGGSPSLFSTNRVATRFHVGEHKRGRGVVFTTPSGHPHPQSSLFHAHATAAAPPSSAWGGTTLSRPTYRYPAPKGASHTLFKPTPEREHASKQAGQRGGTMIVPPPQASAPTPRNANTKRRTQPKRKHQTPATRKQTRPQQACFSTTRANTRSAHTVACGRSQV